MKKISIILTMILLFTTLFSTTVFAEGETGSIVSSSDRATYVIKNDGSLWGWGYSYTGNGNDSGEGQVTPVKILNNVKSVSSSINGGVAVKKDGTLWKWGYMSSLPQNKYLYPEEILDDVKLASLGIDVLAVIKDDDSLWISGGFYIGDGTKTLANSSDVVSPEGFTQVTTDVMDVFIATDTLYFIKNDHTLWGYGKNENAELGNMDFEYALEPVKILDDVKKVHLFEETAFAIRTDNSLYSWGRGWNGDGIYTENGWVEDAGSPYKVMDNVVDVTAVSDGRGVLVLKTDKTLWGWGWEWNDEGYPTTPYKYADDVVAVSGGEVHAALVFEDNTLWTMGSNFAKGLGYTTNSNGNYPLTKIIDNVQDSPASWATDEVDKAIGELLIPDDMQNNYTSSITREEFCILAIRMIEVRSGMTIDEYLEAVGVEIAPLGAFSDCDTKEVRAAKVLGITDGVGGGEFAPDNLLNREQAAKFLTTTAIACGKDVVLGTPAYADTDEIASWAKPYTGYVYDINVMKGVGGNKFDPQGSYQRQQAFMTMYRIWQAIDGVDTDNVRIGN